MLKLTALDVHLPQGDVDVHLPSSLAGEKREPKSPLPQK